MSAPEIRLFQFGDSNVNLFRGDVNTSMTLISLPSRNNLDVGVVLSYRSNIHDQATLWNLEAPTSTLGLGWDLSYERIQLADPTISSLTDRKYFLVNSDSSSLLKASEESWFLFDMGIGFQTTLQDGMVTYALREEFALHSLSLSENCYISGGSKGPWTIKDDDNETIYIVTPSEDKLEVSAGGQGYELENYQFWKIRYYSDYERWVIVKEDGLIASYGGLKTIDRKTIQWGVKWGNWLGSSSLIEGQEQYPVAWNLANNFNIWGDSVAYSYEVIEQAVGSNTGKSYTKACYISSITDVFKRTVSFFYKEKEEREVMDPYKVVPDNQPNSYQSRYETKYLDRIEVKSPDEKLLFAFQFTSIIKNVTGKSESDPLYNQTCKRFLNTIIQENGFGESLPGVKFDYYFDSIDPNPGALKSITSPEGAISLYTYRQEDLPLCEKSITIKRPEGENEEYWTPRIWYGSDYAVIVWYNQRTYDLQISIYTWLGYWYEWTTERLNSKIELNLDSLNVSTSKDSFALYYTISGASTTTLLLCHKVYSSLGKWFLNEEPINYTYRETHPAIYGGNSFFIAFDSDNNILDRYTWDWRYRPGDNLSAWKKESFQLADLFGTSDERDYYISTYGNYYLILSHSPRENGDILKIFSLDDLGNWIDGNTIYPEGIQITGNQFYWTLGDTFAAATYVTTDASSIYKYDIQIFHWDEHHQFISTFKENDLQTDKLIQFIPVLVDNSLIGSGPYLFRFNGKEWLKKEIELEIPPKEENLFWFDYANGLALVTQNSSNQVITTLAVFDPNTDSLQWTGQPLILEDQAPGSRREMSYFPTAAFDYISVGKKIYYRGSSTNWISSTQDPIYEIPEEEIVNTTTIYNQSPSFFTYLQLKDNGRELVPSATKVLNLENGKVSNIETFDEQIYQIYNSEGYLKANLNGQIPFGPDMVTTFGPIDEEDFDDAQFITLRRCLNAAVEGKVRDYSVIKIEVNNGFNTIYTCYDYDLDTAVCDPDGKVIKYYKSRTYQGCQNKSESQDGYIETTYINGLPGETSGITYKQVNEFNNVQENYSVLDGFVESQDTYDAEGALISSQKSDWLVKAVKLNSKGETIPIRGYYTLIQKSTSMLGGIESVSESTYDLFSGQMSKQISWNYNGKGQLEEWGEETTYGYQKYPLLKALNVLSPVVSTQSTVKINDQLSTTGCSVARLKFWEKELKEGAPSLAILSLYDSYQWLGNENGPNFTAWNEADTPGPDWQRTSSVIAKSNQGLNLEVQDIMGHYDSSLYDKNYQYLIASFSNARILEDEADYLGFEDYEEERGWKILPSNETWNLYTSSLTAHTGKRSFILSASTTGMNALQKTFTPATQQDKYLITYWYKTPSGFSQNGEESGCHIMLNQNGTQVSTLFLPFEDTQDEWRYVTQAIDLAPYANQGQTSITVSFCNSLQADIFLDNLRFSPFLSVFSANIYSQSYGLVTASVGPNKETFRNVYDNFQAPVAAIGPDENVSGITFQYYSRQKDDRFLPATPNSLVTISGMEKGFYSDFRRDGTYTLHWQTEESTQWSINEGTLLHTGSSKGTISLISPTIEQKYAVYLIVNPRENVTAPLGVKIGQTTSIAWNPETRQWQLTCGDRKLFSSAQPFMQREWLFSVYDKTFFFFANGEIIFSVLVEENIAGKLSLFAENTVDFSRIVVSNEFQLAISYSDGTDQERQSQLLFEGGSVISQPVYDYLGRAAVTTKSAKLLPNETYPLLSYRPDFVTSLDWDTGVMEGAVAQYYSAEGEGASDDQGYPYSRTRFESSPLSRVIEQGIPGKDFAIVNLSTTTPEERHTTKTFYLPKTSADGFMDWLPAREYFITRNVNPDGNVSLVLTDKNSNSIAQGTLIDPVANKYNMTSSEVTYSNTGQQSRTLLPNYYDPPQPEFKEKWQQIVDVNMLGLSIRSDGPNVGVIETIYDLSGAVRFSQNAEGREKGYYSYVKYDEAERVIEDGIIEGAWDRVPLQDYAHNDPSWPSTPPTWGRKLTYDGDGSHPYLMGQLTSALVHGDLESPEASNQQLFEYNIAGQVVKQTLEVFKNNTSYSTFYTYNNKNSLTRVIYPSPAPKLHEYAYTYNQGGLLESIYSPTTKMEYASYLYNADGSLRTELLVQSLPAKAERHFEYLSPGWLKGISDPYFTQNMYYTKDASGNPGYYSGLIVEEEFNLLSTTALSTTPSYAYRYTYDVLGQLITAENQVNGEINPQWSLGINENPLTYDSNGNFLQSQKGENEKNYVYNSGTDEVKNTKGDQSEGYQYNLIGATTAAEEKGMKSIVYNRASGKETVITTNSEEIKFEYNSSNQRILKSTTVFSKLYLHGLNSRPLVEKIKADSEYDITYVYGSTGLIGFIKEDIFYLVVSDRQGSTRALINQEGQLKQAYTYLPFGGFMDIPDETDTAYLYTSQELDNETKLYNYKARFYDPQMGRFFSTDAAGEFTSPYIYCGNNPVMFIDPSGNLSTGATVGVSLGAVMVGLGAIASIATLGVGVALSGTAAVVLTSIGTAISGGLLAAGTTSISYSAAADDNWNAGIWVGATLGAGAVGGIIGGLTGGIGKKAASSARRAIANRRAARVGVGVRRAKELGDVELQDMAGRHLNPYLHEDSREHFKKMPLTGSDTSFDQGGAIGILNINSGRVDMRVVNPIAETIEGIRFSSQHDKLAVRIYGLSEMSGSRQVEGLGERHNWPNLRGFWVRKTNKKEVRLGFGSQGLNGYRADGSEGSNAIESQEHRTMILMALRKAGIKINVSDNVFDQENGRTYFSLLTQEERALVENG